MPGTGSKVDAADSNKKAKEAMQTSFEDSNRFSGEHGITEETEPNVQTPMNNQ